MNMVHTYKSIGKTGKEGGTIGGPRHARAEGWLRTLSYILKLWTHLIHERFGFEIPNLDGVLGCSAQPVVTGGEAEGLDGVICIQCIEPLAFCKIPKHGNSIFATRCTEGTIWGDGDCVQIASVSRQVEAQFAVGQVPHLHQFVPSAGDDDGIGRDGGESHAAHPFGVSAFLLADGELALTDGVPQLDGFVPRSRNDLTVVDGHGHGQHVFGVSDESPRGFSGAEVPEAEGSIPGSGDGVLSIVGDHHILHEVVVSTQGSPGISVGPFFARQGPHDDALVTRRGQDHVAVVHRRGHGCHLHVPSNHVSTSFSHATPRRLPRSTRTHPEWPFSTPWRVKLSAIATQMCSEDDPLAREARLEARENAAVAARCT